MGHHIVVLGNLNWETWENVIGKWRQRSHTIEKCRDPSLVKPVTEKRN